MKLDTGNLKLGIAIKERGYPALLAGKNAEASPPPGVAQ
jgi:hypothetical protein